jgi:hypothetical protein
MRIEIVNKYTDNLNWYYDINFYNNGDEMIDRYSGVIFNHEPTNEELDERCVTIFNNIMLNKNITDELNQIDII